MSIDKSAQGSRYEDMRLRPGLEGLTWPRELQAEESKPYSSHVAALDGGTEILCSCAACTSCEPGVTGPHGPMPSLNWPV